MPTLSDHWSLTSTRTNVSSVRYNKQLDILLFATDKNFGCTSTLAHYAVFNSCTLIFSVLCFAWCFSAFLFFISFAKFPNWCEMQLLFGFPFLVMVGRSGISTSPLATPPTWAMSLFASLPIPVFFFPFLLFFYITIFASKLIGKSLYSYENQLFQIFLSLMILYIYDILLIS